MMVRMIPMKKMTIGPEESETAEARATVGAVTRAARYANSLAVPIMVLASMGRKILPLLCLTTEW